MKRCKYRNYKRHKDLIKTSIRNALTYSKDKKRYWNNLIDKYSSKGNIADKMLNLYKFGGI